MIRTLSLAAIAATLVAVPAASQAQVFPGDPYYGGYNGQAYYGNRCSGTTGTIVGGLAGAYVGSRVIGNRQRYDRYGSRRGGSGTTGALIGGAVGALLGRSVDKQACQRRNGGYYNGYNGYRY